MAVQVGPGSDIGSSTNGIPATTKATLNITTYEELLGYVQDLVKIMEEIYELGILKGTIKQYEFQMENKDDDEDDSDIAEETDTADESDCIIPSTQ